MLTDKWLHITNGLLGSAFIGLLALIYLNEPVTRYRHIQKPSMFLKSKKQHLEPQKRVIKKVAKRPELTLNMMKNEVLNIAPGVYYSVRLELESGEDVSLDQEYADLKSLSIKFVEIFTKSQSWDRLRSQEKIDLLYRTFMLLKRRYPFLSQSVRLAFDDDRQKLEFKFDDIQKMGRQASTILTPGRRSGGTGIIHPTVETVG